MTAIKTNSSPWCSSTYIYFPLSRHQLLEVLPHGSGLTLLLAYSSPFIVTGAWLLLSLQICPAILTSLLSYFHRNDRSTVPLMSLLLSCFKLPVSRNTSHSLARGYLSVTQHALENILYVLLIIDKAQVCVLSTQKFSFSSSIGIISEKRGGLAPVLTFI